MQKHSRRYQQPLSLILLDTDLFKAYNDLYGHQTGNSYIKKFDKVMKRFVKRSIDQASRYG